MHLGEYINGVANHVRSCICIQLTDNHELAQSVTLFKTWEIPSLFYVYFRLFQQTFQFLQKINMKIVHPEYGAGIRRKSNVGK